MVHMSTPEAARPPDDTGRQIMIVAGEASGDLHGAHLVQAMRELEPGLRFCGLGGRELKAAGVEILYDAARLAVVGLTEVISHLGDLLAARRILLKRMRERQPALLILIDFPDFNLLLAAKAKKLGIPVFYYISPQVWAWRSGRVRKIGRLADRIGVILPFEQEFYHRRGVQVDFVGHPLMDSVHATMSRDEFLAGRSIDPDKVVVGLLPGSRKKEIISLLPPFLAAARLLTERSGQNFVFLLPRASTISPELLEENGVGRYRDSLDLRVIDEKRYDLMAACDAVVVASGTVTLELAILGVPTVVTYRFSPRTYHLGRLLIKLQWFSLVNLIAGRTVIPELLQAQVTPDNIARELRVLLEDREARATMLRGLAEVREKLGGPGASRRAARIALNIAKR
ncbi:lipid-A-disaccharide synthase [bacterium BMS3Abin13]|nr:lipid-A-disaccharide synthase [bacterium BMS3Abin13]